MLKTKHINYNLDYTIVLHSKLFRLIRTKLPNEIQCNLYYRKWIRKAQIYFRYAYKIFMEIDSTL